MERQLVSSGTDWEAAVGYSRAVRTGSQIHVSGTTATDANGNIVGVGDPYKQTTKAIENIEKALAQAGASLADVVRTHLFVVDIDDWEAIGAAHAEAFGETRPSTSMLEVSRLIDPKLCVEIEATAVDTDSDQL